MPEQTPLVLDGEFTVYVAHDLKTRLLGAMAADGSLTLDLGDISEFDGAGLQLLLAAGHECRARGGQLVISAASPVVCATLALAGLQALCPDPVH